MVAAKNCYDTKKAGGLVAELVLSREEATAALFTPHLARVYGLPFVLSLPMTHLDAV